MTQTLIPNVTPQQQMALAFRDFSLPEGTVLADGSVKVWSLKVDGEGRQQWAEAIGRDAIDAVHRLAFEIARRA